MILKLFNYQLHRIHVTHVIQEKNNQHFNENISATAFINSCRHLCICINLAAVHLKLLLYFAFCKFSKSFKGLQKICKNRNNISLNVLSINSPIRTFISRHTELCNMPTLVRKTVSLLAPKVFIYVQQYMMSTGDARSS